MNGYIISLVRHGDIYTAKDYWTGKQWTAFKWGAYKYKTFRGAMKTATRLHKRWGITRVEKVRGAK